MRQRTAIGCTLVIALLGLAWVGFLVPLIWVGSPAFSFAEYSLHPWPLGIGVACPGGRGVRAGPARRRRVGCP
jgi:hypothetical protein